MNQKQKDEITAIAKEFTEGMEFPINGSGWLVVDPLSGYLNALGYKNVLSQIPSNNKHPLVLVMLFEGGTFIPAGGDLKPLDEKFQNWIWI